MSELRWNPILQEWIITATHRQERTFLPPPDYCPLCPTQSDQFQTEVPAPDFQIVAFQNKFPSLQHPPPEPAITPTNLYKVKPADGICEVVLYCPQHQGSLTDRPIEDIHKLIYVWTDRYQELGALDFIHYVLIFENKGEVIGVTLHHPHGQIYAFPFVPPIIQKELNASRQHYRKTKNCLFCDIIEEETNTHSRIIAQNRHFLAFIPFYARWPYEVHIFPKKHKLSLAELDAQEKWNLAQLLKIILLKYDNLWGFSLPYMMLMHQKPTDGKPHNYYHFHIEFYPPNRAKDKLKFLASCESGAGTFINDTLPEQKAKELRQAPPKTL